MYPYPTAVLYVQHANNVLIINTSSGQTAICHAAQNVSLHILYVLVKEFP